MAEPILHSVAVTRAGSAYPPFPYSPAAPCPEYSGSDFAAEPNGIYEAVRENFRLLGFDIDHYGTPQWNPLGHLIRPGDTVFIKPNWVDHRHRFDADLWSVITHPAIIRAVLDYVLLALNGTGRVIVGDNPHVDTRFDVLRQVSRLDDLAVYYRDPHGAAIPFIDCRLWAIENLDLYGYKAGRIPLPGDPAGTREVDLGAASLFHGMSTARFRGTYNDRRETRRFHRRDRHAYVFSKSMYDADVFISIPKLKAHAKVGATLNIKGLIGAIANKNGLVHWQIGYPSQGGDEYPEPERRSDLWKLSLQHLLMDWLPEPFHLAGRNLLRRFAAGRALLRRFQTEAQRLRMLRGSAALNDTTWRMTCDVYNLFVRDLPNARGKPVRFLSVIDGIRGGDTDGPHFPCPVSPGIIVTGKDLLATDLAAVRLMDFDDRQIQYLSHLEAETPRRVRILSSDFPLDDIGNRETPMLGYRPPYRWENISLRGLKPGPSYLPL
ncbi:MAG: DUF362 domain-containing protein [Kiritimatiellae bacterium]|nr:DUF362 domain-containing protein [Kiritimatiellia bacterium]